MERTVNEVWSVDFVSDSLANGRRMKCLTVADDSADRIRRSKWLTHCRASPAREPPIVRPWISAFGSLGLVARTEDPCEFTDFARHHDDRIASPDQWIQNVSPEFSCYAPKCAPRCPPEHGIHFRTSSHDFAGL